MRQANLTRTGLLLTSAVLMLGCERSLPEFDFDFRGAGGQFDTSQAAADAVTARPQPDARGVVSYPSYQVALARRGDTVRGVAARVGVSSAELAAYNALPEDATLNEGALLALPRRVAEPGGGGRPGQGIDVATIAGDAITRAETGTAGQPTRHQVRAGETAFSIARLYDVPVASLAEWNGLGPDLAIRQGQYLLIPIKTAAVSAPAASGDVQVAALPVEAPGAGSATPLPPSAAAPLPTENEAPRVEEVVVREAPGQNRTEASDTARLRMPVAGRIARPFKKGSSEGIGIAASAGSTVVAADEGTVAAITRDTEGVPILVIRHEGNLLTVYAGVDNITVAKGDSVSRGQKIAVVRAGDPAMLHFEVREGFDSVDPAPYLN